MEYSGGGCIKPVWPRPAGVIAEFTGCHFLAAAARSGQGTLESLPFADIFSFNFLLESLARD